LFPTEYFQGFVFWHNGQYLDVGKSMARWVFPTKVAGTLRRAVRWCELTIILGERHMECAYYFVFGFD
jgi:hypothetical protein